MQMVSLFSDVFKCSFTTKCQSLAKFKAMRMFSPCFAKRKHFNEHWQSNSSKTHHAQNYRRKHARFVLRTECIWHFPTKMTSADIRVLCSVLEPFWKSAISIEPEHRLCSMMVYEPLDQPNVRLCQASHRNGKLLVETLERLRKIMYF